MIVAAALTPAPVSAAERLEAADLGEAPAATLHGDTGSDEARVPDAEGDPEEADRRDQDAAVDRLDIRRVSTQAKAVVQSAIETIDIGANTASASAASSWVGRAASSSTTTAPVPASPCRRPMRERLARRAHRPMPMLVAALAQMAQVRVPSPVRA